MTEANRKKIMYGILILALVWGGWNFTHPRKKRIPPQGDIAAVAPAVDSTSTRKLSIDIDGKRSEPWGRDPFRGSSVRVATVQTDGTGAGRSVRPLSKGWSLTGIIDNGSTPFAFINGKMVKVGDLVDQARVVKIEKHKVTLSHNGTEIFLQVNKG